MSSGFESDSWPLAPLGSAMETWHLPLELKLGLQKFLTRALRFSLKSKRRKNFFSDLVRLFARQLTGLAAGSACLAGDSACCSCFALVWQVCANEER